MIDLEDFPVVDKDNKIKVIFTQGDFVSYTWPDLFYQAKQMAKASLSKNFNVTSIIVMVMIYSFAMIFAVRMIYALKTTNSIILIILSTLFKQVITQLVNSDILTNWFFKRAI